MKPTIGTSGDRAVNIDLARLIESRLLAQANSGAGKSWLIRRLLEQTHGAVQQIVIDVEDEFHTLRERYDYVLAGRHGGDCPADVKSAPLLARRLLELGVSAIVGIYELRAHDRVRFVRQFLDAIVNAPRDLWHPALIVVDEAHIFAPQQGQAESASAVIDLMTRGRKRGFCGVLATQRISKLHKDAAAECNNKLIGRSALDVDMRRAADELGFTSKEDQRRLRTLKPGHFFGFGPAISDEVIELQVGPVETTHPKAGQRAAAPPPPRAKVKRVLAQLADIPREAEDEARTAAELQAQVKELQRELRAARKTAAPSPPPKPERVLVTPVTPQMAEQLVADAGRLEELVAEAQKIARSLGRVGKDAGKALDRIHEGRMPFGPKSAPVAAPRTPPARAPRPAAEPSGDLTGPEQRILDAIAWLEGIGVDEPELAAVAFLAGYKPGGGAFNNPRGRLRAKGLVEYGAGGRMRLTVEGRTMAAALDVPPTTEGLHAAVLERLSGPERRILQPLLDAYPVAMANAELAEAAGYGAGGGAFNNPKGRLRTLGLVDYPAPGQVVARDILFPEAR